MSTALIFRDARREDLPLVVALMADDEFGGSRECPDEPLDQGYWQGFAAIQDDPRTHLIVAEQDGQVVGTMHLYFLPSMSQIGAARLIVESVHVPSALRGQGIGAAMMRWAVDLAKARGCRTVRLTSDKRRTRAHHFYERLGFTAVHVGFKYVIPD